MLMGLHLLKLMIVAHEHSIEKRLGKISQGRTAVGLSTNPHHSQRKKKSAKKKEKLLLLLFQ